MPVRRGLYVPKTRLVRIAILFGGFALLISGCKAQGTDGGITSTAETWGDWLSRDEVTSEAVCETGYWPDEGGRCAPAEDVFTSAGGQTYWVDQQSSLADDQNPGTRDRPWRTINRASTLLRPGDAVIIRAGIYHESITPRTGGSGPDRRITYAAYPGEEVIVSGADITQPESWTREGNAWRRLWDGPELPMYSDEGDPVMRREMLVANGEVLRPVFRREDVEPGTFFIEGSDVAQVAIVARFRNDVRPGEVGPIEVAQRTFLFQPLGENPYPECGGADTPGWLHVAGITFRHAANRAQWGAFCGGREGGLVERVTVEWTNGAGIDGSGRDHVFRNVAANYNGQIGFVASCEGCLFEDSETIGNNWKGYDPFWEAGGGKWSDTRQSIIRRHFAADNGGPGIWLDGSNVSNTIESSVAVRNEVAGIMLELETTQTLVQHNYVAETRWRGYSGSGVLSQAASRNAFSHNTVIRNEGNGIWLRLDPDRRAEDGFNLLHNNVVVANAWTTSEEAREITVEGTTLEHSRTNRFDGNVYGRHAINDLRTSTFFFMPDPASDADFRSGDLAGWQRLTGSDDSARILDPGEVSRDPADLPFSLPGNAALLPELLRGFGAKSGAIMPFGLPGANREFLPARLNLNDN